MLEHGGNLNDAVQRFQRPREDWLDLSTGINPQAYPVPELAPDTWHRLPETSTALVDAARAYYGALDLLPVAGTQAAIQALPQLRPPSRVAIGAPAYAEHAYRWRRAGHAVREVGYAELDCAVDESDVIVICNPNNPTGEMVSPAVLQNWARRLALRGGWLVVDEAFADPTPQHSIAASSEEPGIVVLRSVGKFFGLAGLRLGFVAASPDVLRQLAEALGPWSVSRAAQEIGCAALSDRAWQEAMRAQLLQGGKRLESLLAANGIASNGCALFQWWPEHAPESFHRHMAQRGIWVRLFREKARGIRLGLPLHEHGWKRLEHALSEWKPAEARR